MFLDSGKMFCIVWQPNDVGDLDNLAKFNVSKTIILDREGNAANESLEEVISGILNTHCA